MDLESVRWLSSLGVGGSLAGLMFIFYRKDAIASEARWRGQSEQLLLVVKQNTEAMTALTGELHRRRD